MKKLINFINKNIFVIWVLVAVISALYTINVYHTKPAESFLKYFLFYPVGIALFSSFFLHSYQPTADKIAKGLGWQTGSPFQKEVGAADGAFGLLGILSGWIYGDFWTATAIGASFMLFFMGIGHLIDIINNKNKSPLNAGSVVWFGLLFPIVLIITLILYKMGY